MTSSNEPYLPHINDPDPPQPRLSRVERLAAVRALPQPKPQEEQELSEEEAWKKHWQRQRELAGPAYRLPDSQKDRSR
jgi:hypothetical protein